MNVPELFYWCVMVLSGYFLIQCVIGTIKDLMKGELVGAFVELVFAVVAWNIHRWAFVHLVPLQTLF